MISKFFLGSARVDITSIDLSYGVREIDPRIIDRLTKLFTQVGCQRLNPQNNVPIFIEYEDLKHILDASHLTIKELSQSKETGQSRHLSLPRSRKLRCLHGRHRLIAALSFLPVKEQWWIVNIFSSSKESMSTGYINVYGY